MALQILAELDLRDLPPPRRHAVEHSHPTRPSDSRRRARRAPPHVSAPSPSQRQSARRRVDHLSPPCILPAPLHVPATRCSTCCRAAKMQRCAAGRWAASWYGNSKATKENQSGAARQITPQRLSLLAEGTGRCERGRCNLKIWTHRAPESLPTWLFRHPDLHPSSPRKRTSMLAERRKTISHELLLL